MKTSERAEMAYKLEQLVALLNNTVTADLHDVNIDAKAAYLHHCAQVASELSEQLEA